MTSIVLAVVGGPRLVNGGPRQQRLDLLTKDLPDRLATRPRKSARIWSSCWRVNRPVRLRASVRAVNQAVHRGLQHDEVGAVASLAVEVTSLRVELTCGEVRGPRCERPRRGAARRARRSRTRVVGTDAVLPCPEVVCCEPSIPEEIERAPSSSSVARSGGSSCTRTPVCWRMSIRPSGGLGRYSELFGRPSRALRWAGAAGSTLDRQR